MSFKILSVDTQSGEMVIDWGDRALNHWIPKELTEGDELTQTQIAEIILAMRPEDLEPVTVPAAMANMLYVPPLDLAEDAKYVREEAITAPIEYPAGEGTEYLVDVGFREIYFDALLAGYPDETSRQWRLADNRWRLTSLGDMKALMGLFRARKDAVWAQFNEWDAGDKVLPFFYGADDA